MFNQGVTMKCWTILIQSLSSFLHFVLVQAKYYQAKKTTLHLLILTFPQALALEPKHTGLKLKIVFTIFAKPIRFSKILYCMPLSQPKIELINKSKGESHYFVTFIDDDTRKLWVFFLKHKSNVFDVLLKKTTISSKRKQQAIT